MISSLLRSLVRPWSERRIHGTAWAVAIGLGLLQAFAHRFTMSIDGVSYVDIAENVRQHDWSHAVTGHWSPLFPALLGVALALVRPNSYWEFPLVHAVELIIYIVALAGFTFFLIELAGLRDRKAAQIEEAILPRALLLIFGYATFLWTSLILIKVYDVVPDMLVAGILYFVCALLMRIRQGTAGNLAWLFLGILLGLGYLAKTILLFIAPAFLAAAFLVDSDRRAVRWRLALAIGAWLAIAIPWIGILSDSKGRLTFGDAGRDTYVWEVGNLPYTHWQGGPSGYGEPLHPTRLIHTNPPLYEFGEPVDGTYPVWYDPSYWFDGVRPRFSLRLQVLAIIRSLVIYWQLLDVFVFSWFVLFIIGLRRRSDLYRPFFANAFLLFPAALALFLYSLVHVLDRYIAGFWTIAILALMLGLRLPRSDLSLRIYRASVVVTVLVLMAEVCLMALTDIKRSLDPPEEWHSSVAIELRRMGVEPGDRVAWIGGNFEPVWARLARAQIVAEVPVEHSARFWSADQEVRDQILERLAAAGAEVVYASSVPSWAPSSGWKEIGNSRFARRLP